MLTRRDYAVTLTTLEPFRVGGKEDPLSEADNPIAVVGGRGCIPGATLKGAFRAEIERWLNDQFFSAKDKRWTNVALQPCIPSTRLSQDEEGLVARGRFRAQACVYREDSSNRTICPACYLLGAQSLVGFVNVPFLFTSVGYEGLYSARLERTSRTVMKGTNRGYQLIPPRTDFTGEMEVLLEDDLLGWTFGKPRPLKENPEADAWLNHLPADWDQTRILKEFVVDRLQAIERLGGYRSKGFGKVKIQVVPTPEAKAP